MVVLVDEIFVRLDLFNLDLLVGHLLPLSLGVPLPAPLIVLFSFLRLEAVLISPNESCKNRSLQFAHLLRNILLLDTPREILIFSWCLKFNILHLRSQI